MKTSQLIFLLLLALTLFSCMKDEDENPAKVTIVFTGEENWNTVKNDDYLKVNVSVDFESSAQGLSVETVECFLGNRKIVSAKGTKCEVLYKIENAPIGRHEFRAEAVVTAPGYDKILAAGYYDVNVEN